MHALATLELINPTTEIIIVVVIVVASVALRLYLIRRHSGTRAKCPKCGVVFEASRSISLVHLGPLKQIKCPSCGKTSFMKAGVKDPITWPPEMVKREPQAEKPLSEEELEKRRIEDSKYEKT